ncbi:MAG: P-II family nitrogen regulator [Burkholderiales bacterium]
MKLVTAIIQPFKLEELRSVLSTIGIRSITVTEIKGFGQQKEGQEFCRVVNYRVKFFPKIRIEFVIENEMLHQVIDCVECTEKTGIIEGSRIFVANLEQVIRIGAGEMNINA